MPNHIHLVVLPQEDTKLGRIIGELKSLTAKEILAFWREKDFKILSRLSVVREGIKRNVFWQRRFYDHNCRTQSSVIEKINYCHSNPVIRGLVKNPGDWRWSSYRWYHGLDGIAIEIDSVELWRKRTHRRAVGDPGY
jgi:putative transposase